MNQNEEINIRLVVSRRQLKVFLSLLLVLGLAYALESATVRFSTTYPSPSGFYRKLVTTQDTLLARDSGNVGIGTSDPQAKLDVNGAIKVGVMTADPAGALGMVYYNSSSNKYRSYTNVEWKDLAGGLSLIGPLIPSGPLNPTSQTVNFFLSESADIMVLAYVNVQEDAGAGTVISLSLNGAQKDEAQIFGVSGPGAVAGVFTLTFREQGRSGNHVLTLSTSGSAHFIRKGKFFIYKL